MKTPLQKLICFLGLLIAGSFHFTVFVPVGQVDVRLTSGDIILPFAVLIVIAAFIYSGLQRPHWIVLHIDIALFFFFIWLGVACPREASPWPGDP